MGDSRRGHNSGCFASQFSELQRAENLIACQTLTIAGNDIFVGAE